MLKRSGVIVSILLSLTLLLLTPISGSTSASSAILVPNCGTGSTSLVPSVSQVATGPTVTIMSSCVTAGSAITGTNAGSVIPQFSLPSSYSSLEISTRSTCAAAVALTSGSPVVFGTGPGMLPITNYNYCAGFSNVPSAGLATFPITWSTETPPADFSLTPTSTTINIAANSIGTDSLRVDALNGFVGTVSFTGVGSPFGGVSYDCSSVTLSSTVTSAMSTCSFGSSSPGTYNAIVNGTGGTPPTSHQVSYTITVTKASPSVSTTLSASAIAVGGSVTDSATLTGTDLLTAGGSVTYQFFTGSTCVGAGTVVGSPVVVNAGLIPTSASQTFSSAGLFSWNAAYSGDANNNAALSSCETLSVVTPAGFTISASPALLTVAPGEAHSCEGQGNAQRCDDEGSSTITVTGLNGFSSTVTLTISTSPNLSASLSPATITGSGTSTLTVSEGKPGNYSVTVTGTSGSIAQSVVVNVIVRPPVPLKCGGDSDCKIESDAPLSDVRFENKKIHFTVDGTAGATGAVNVTIPRSAVPDIDRIEVSVDGARLSRSALMIVSDDSIYHVYFSFKFHSPAVIEINLAPSVTILGLAPLAFYGIVGAGIAVVVIGGILTIFRRRRVTVKQ